MSFAVFIYLWITFWIVTYYFEAVHDAAICEIEVDLAKYQDVRRKAELSKRWHLFDGFMFALMHLFLTLLAVVLFDFWSGVVLLSVSLGIRVLLHDTLIEMLWKGKIFRPTMNGAWDYWDGIQAYLDERFGLSPLLFRIIISLILVLPLGFVL